MLGVIYTHSFQQFQTGHLLLAFLNPESQAGEALQAGATQSPFYQKAKFLFPQEVLQLLTQAGFNWVKANHCLKGNAAEPGFLQVQTGLGPGLFTAVLATKFPDPPRTAIG